jgi:hypothetical protein
MCPEFWLAFARAMQSDLQLIHDSQYKRMENLLVQPLKSSGISTVIITDALGGRKDGQPASAILSVMGRFVAKISKVKYFVTGRPSRAHNPDSASH